MNSWREMLEGSGSQGLTAARYTLKGEWMPAHAMGSESLSRPAGCGQDEEGFSRRTANPKFQKLTTRR